MKIFFVQFCVSCHLFLISSASVRSIPYHFCSSATMHRAEEHRSVAERSFPSPRSGAAVKRSYPTSMVRGGSWEELPRVRGQGRWLGGSTPRPRPGAAEERSNPKSKELWLCRRRRAKRSYSMFRVRRGSCEEILLVQGKEQRLCFAGAAVKKYPTSKVRKTQVRQQVLQEGIRGQTH